MKESNCKVTVVVPSTGREDLVAAIASVTSQTIFESIQLIVVFDRPEAEVPLQVKEAALKSGRVEYTGGGKGASFARNVGVRLADSEWIAFLDDDDRWEPTKIQLQVNLAEILAQEGKDPVVGCRADLVSSAGRGKSISQVPKRLIGPRERIDEYLFYRRRPGGRRASFFTSSILTSTALCRQITWSEGLRRHQDWDWLLRAADRENVCFSQLPESLVAYSLGSPGSISSTSDWTSSLTWASAMRSRFTRRAYVDFLCAQPLRYALQSKQFNGIKSVLQEVKKSAEFPSSGPILIGLAGLLPRKTMQQLMGIFR